MALSQRLELRQTQGLVMTPQLMQAIKLLQLSSLDLAAYVENELERNPLLERANDDEPPAAAAETNSQPPETSEDSASNADWMGADLETSRSSMEQGLGTELLQMMMDRARSRNARRLFLEVHESNTAARALYEKCGFAPGGRRRAYYSRPSEDAVLYTRKL